jgi:hypothetical protein
MNTARETHEVAYIAGIFDEEPQASKAVKGLLSEHFGSCDHLEVIASNRHDREVVRIRERFPTWRYAFYGAFLGAFFTEVGIGISGIGFGPFTLTDWGPYWAVFEAGWIGASVGFALGALLSIEPADPELAFDALRIRDGVVWVGLRAAGARARRARQILSEAGARHLMEREPEEADFHHFRPMAV